MTDTAMLRQIIKDSGLKLSYIANYLDLSPYGLSLKIDNVNEFRTSEVDKLCELLHIDSLERRFAVFFAKKVDGKSTDKVS